MVGGYERDKGVHCLYDFVFYSSTYLVIQKARPESLGRNGGYFKATCL